MSARARTRATLVIARRRLVESLLSPGYAVALTGAMLIGYVLVRGFTRTLDSGGLDYQLQPVYAILGGALSGAFGEVLVAKVFAEGPLLLAIHLSFGALLLYLALSSVFRSGLEKRVGAIELLSYGPADETAYHLASFLVDALLAALALLVLLGFAALGAAANNLALGRQLLAALPALLLLALGVHAYAALASALTDGAASAVAVFLVLIVLFAATMLGALSVATGYVRTLSALVGGIVNWVSPMFYWTLVMQGVQRGQPLLALAGGALLAVLTTLVLFGGHLVVRARSRR